VATDAESKPTPMVRYFTTPAPREAMLTTSVNPVTSVHKHFSKLHTAQLDFSHLACPFSSHY